MWSDERRWGKAKACPEQSRRGGNLFRRPYSWGALIALLVLLVVILGCGGATPTDTPILTPTPTLLPALIPTTTATPAPTVTSEPIPTLTSTATPTATPTTIPLPQRPLIRLRHDGQVYSGAAGTSCWPVDAVRPGDRLCADEGPFPWEVLDTATAVPVSMGDSIIVEIDADDRPNGLQVAIFDSDSKAASAAAAQVIELEAGFTAPFTVDLLSGTYYIHISGQWDDGDIAYKFKMVVTSSPMSSSLPQRPLIRLRHDGQVYSGVAGTSCWPVDAARPGDRLCADEGPFPWEVLDTATAVPVSMGDSVIVVIDADDRPNGLKVAIFDSDSTAASAAAALVIDLEAGFTAPFTVDLPSGTYYIRISGQWDDGDIAYKFKMAVTASPMSSEEHTLEENPIEFVMKDKYLLGEAIEIGIRNNSSVSFLYNIYQPACENLEFYGGSGLFGIPEGAHCDIPGGSELKPGEEVVLLTWKQEECIAADFGCIESVPVTAGRYRIVGEFYQSKGPPQGRPDEGSKTVIDWSFIIESPLAELAKEDLARRLGVPVAAIEVKSAEPVSWPDTSMGCPEPGSMYAQVITPGYRIILSYESKEYSYHSDSDGPPFLCEKPSPIAMST